MDYTNEYLKYKIKYSNSYSKYNNSKGGAFVANGQLYQINEADRILINQKILSLTKQMNSSDIGYLRECIMLIKNNDYDMHDKVLTEEKASLLNETLRSLKNCNLRQQKMLRIGVFSRIKIFFLMA